MKFVKGIFVGSLLTTGVIMVCTDTNMFNKNKLMKNGKKIIRKLGII